MSEAYSYPRRVVTAADIARKIAKLIRQRQMNPGERLREQELADLFGVSRGSVREAFRMLETSGLLDAEPMRGVTIRRMSEAELADSCYISGYLMGLASRRMAESATPEQCAELRRRVENFIARGPGMSIDEFIAASVRCGDYIFRVAGSRVLTEHMRSVYIQGPALIYAPLAFATKTLRQRNVKVWAKLLEAIESGDGPRAEQVARAMHLRGLDSAMSLVGRVPVS